MTTLQRGMQEEAPENNNCGYKVRVTIYPNGGNSETVFVSFWDYPHIEGEPKRLAEIYLSTTKSGSSIDKWLKSLGKNSSRLLQSGVPASVLANKLINDQGPLAGSTNLVDIPQISGVEDLLGKLILARYGNATSNPLS